jgi:prepilin-type N-terminal cleavage/methylation domain-containing protein
LADVVYSGGDRRERQNTVGRRKRKAVTLVEVLVASALFSICLTTVWMMVSAGALYLRTSDSVTQMQAQAVRALGVMVREFPDTDPGATCNSTTLPGVSGIAFPSPRDPATGIVDYDSVGRMLWPGYVCYYLDPSSLRLVRAYWPNNPVPNDVPPSLTDLSYVIGGSVSTRVLATGVENFTAFVQNQGPVNITLGCGLTTGTGKNYEILLQTNVYCRN